MVTRKMVGNITFNGHETRSSSHQEPLIYCDLANDALACVVERDRASRKLLRCDLTKREKDCRFGFCKMK